VSRATELSRQLDSLLEARRQAQVRLAVLDQEYKTLCTQHEPEIGRLAKQADLLAIQFKELARASRAAYEAGETEVAGSLGSQRREKQAQCESLNHQANALREILAQRLRRLVEERASMRDAAVRISKTRSQLELSRSTRVRGFDHLKDGGRTFVEGVLDSLPSVILDATESITYVDQVDPPPRSAIGITTGKPLEPGLARITLYRTPLELSGLDQEIHYARALMHEAGHVVFSKLMS
jgi:hypothetical protein